MITLVLQEILLVLTIHPELGYHVIYYLVFKYSHGPPNDVLVNNGLHVTVVP